jgi:hypothetical protein
MDSMSVLVCVPHLPVRSLFFHMLTAIYRLLKKSHAGLYTCTTFSFFFLITQLWTENGCCTNTHTASRPDGWKKGAIQHPPSNFGVLVCMCGTIRFHLFVFLLYKFNESQFPFPPVISSSPPSLSIKKFILLGKNERERKESFNWIISKDLKGHP